MLITRISRQTSRRVVTLKEELTFLIAIDNFPQGKLIYTIHHPDSIHMPGINVLEYTSPCCASALALNRLDSPTPQRGLRGKKKYAWACNGCHEKVGEILELTDAQYDRELATKQLSLYADEEINVAEVTEFLIPWISDKQYFDEFTVIIEAHELARELKARILTFTEEKDS